MKLSLIVPTIRSHFLNRFIESVENSYSGDWEVVLIGPFDPPTGIDKWPVKFLKSYDTVPVCIQRGTQLADGDLVLHGVDDSIYIPDMLDQAVEFFKQNCEYEDALGMTYVENTNDMTPVEKWTVRNCPEFHLPYI